jgi:hypothetical protein
MARVRSRGPLPIYADISEQYALRVKNDEAGHGLRGGGAAACLIPAVRAAAVDRDGVARRMNGGCH